MDISLIVPAYNEAHRIGECLEALLRWGHKHNQTFEILVVSNGCTDTTDDVVSYYATYDPVVRLLSSEKGKGAAVKADMLAARGGIRLMADADLSTPPDYFHRLISPLLFNSADVAIASREGPNAERYDESWQRHLSGRVFNLLIQAVALPGILDSQCGFKAFSARAADLIFPRVTIPGFAFDVEALYIARRLGLRISQVGVPWWNNLDTRVDLWADSRRMLADVLSIRRNDKGGAYYADQARTAPAK